MKIYANTGDIRGRNYEGIYANGVLVAGNSNANFNNTASMNVRATGNGSMVDLAYTVNASAVVATGNSSNLKVTYESNGQAQFDYVLGQPGVGGGSYQVDVLAAGAVVVSNANINYINSATVNATVTANGSTQANVSFNVNASAITLNTALFNCITLNASSNAFIGNLVTGNVTLNGIPSIPVWGSPSLNANFATPAFVGATTLGYWTSGSGIVFVRGTILAEANLNIANGQCLFVNIANNFPPPPVPINFVAPCSNQLATTVTGSGYMHCTLYSNGALQYAGTPILTNNIGWVSLDSLIYSSWT